MNCERCHREWARYVVAFGQFCSWGYASVGIRCALAAFDDPNTDAVMDPPSETGWMNEYPNRAALAAAAMPETPAIGGDR